MAETVYILLGANVGDRARNLELALDKLEHVEGLEIVAASGIYVSDAVEMQGEQPTFMNQVIKAEFLFRPMELLHALERVERELGRTDKGKLQPRTIDCDILLFGDQIIQEAALTVPHPRLLQRAFAMIPLIEIDPHIVHPITRQPVASYVSAADHDRVVLYKDHVARNI
jgi:2-amino-4-hydroxy-6-hydroxymethyldihydropteridine diphosphokinase